MGNPRQKHDEPGTAGTPDTEIPRRDWHRFLSAFSRDHDGWRVRLETRDRVTREDVTSEETPLESIDYDLEDVHNPRINVVVRLDNKVIKHILFRPSRMVLRSTGDGRPKCLDVTTVNTETSVHLRPPEAREGR